MKLQVTKNTTSKLVQVFIRDSSKTDGSGLTGLVFNSASLSAYYYREGAASATSITLVTMTVGTWASGGFKEIDSTNLPGWYQLGLPDAAIASGANTVDLLLKGATNMVPVPIEIQLQNMDVYDGVRAGLTALPNAAAGATGGLDCMVTLGGTASAGGNTSITLAGGSATDNLYNHQVVQITAGAGAGQARIIVAYAGSTKVATVSRAWATNPDNTSVYQVKGIELTPTWQAFAGVATAGGSTSVTLPAGASTTSSIYNGCLAVITAGTGQRQARVITAYNGSTLVATVDRAWQTNPDSTSVVVIYGADLAATDASLQIAANAVNGNLTGSVGSVTAGVTVATNNDKTGYSLANNAVDAAQFTQAAADKVWSSATRTLTAFAQGFADQVWTSAARTLTAFAQGFSDQTWSSATRTLTAFSTTLAQSVWDVLTSAISAAGSIGLQVKTNLDATVSSRLPTSSYVVPPTAAAIAAQLIATTLTELAQAQPAVTPTVNDALMLAYMLIRNGELTTANQRSIRNGAGTVVAKATMSDDGTVFNPGTLVSGP